MVYYDATATGTPILFKPVNSHAISLLLVIVWSILTDCLRFQGKLEATSWDAAGKVLATSTVATTKAAASLKLSLDQPGVGDVRVSGPVGSIKADGQDVALVRVEVVDSDGVLVPDADHNITFSVTGRGAIYGVVSSHAPTLLLCDFWACC